MKGVFTCPDDMDPAAVSLLQGLMEKDVSKRIGRLANGADDMRRHPWYSEAGFDWVSDITSQPSPLVACLAPAPARPHTHDAHLTCAPVLRVCVCLSASCSCYTQPLLQSLKMEPPFIPTVGGDEDTSCFVVEADSDEEDPAEWQDASQPIDPADQHLFEGF